MIKISVIIPVYNTGPYLRECLDSVIGQTLQEIEIICINDGSTDNSFAILEEYAKKDNRIILLSQENKGGGAARNNGLGIAKGEYLSFLDSDDFFELDALEKFFITAEEKNADVVVCNNKRYDAVSKKSWGGAYHLNRNDFPANGFSFADMKKNIFDTLGTLVWNKLFKRDFINKHNILFQEIRRTNDLFFSFSALMYARRIAVLYDSLIYYRIRKKDDCPSLNYKAPLDFYTAILAFYQKMIEANLYNNLEKWYLDFIVGSCQYNLEFQVQVDSFEHVYNLIKNEIFKRFGILEKPKEYYKDSHYNWMKKVERQTVVEYLFYQRKDRPDSINGPFSFFLGRMLTWFPRKLQGFFRCLKENGFVYTFRLFVKKFSKN